VSGTKELLADCILQLIIGRRRRSRVEIVVAHGGMHRARVFRNPRLDEEPRRCMSNREQYVRDERIVCDPSPAPNLHAAA